MTQIKVIRERQTDTQTDRHPERQSQLTNYFHYTLQKLVYSVDLPFFCFAALISVCIRGKMGLIT